jgi:hypothetical protein
MHSIAIRIRLLAEVRDIHLLESIQTGPPRSSVLVDKAGGVRS